MIAAENYLSIYVLITTVVVCSLMAYVALTPNMRSKDYPMIPYAMGALLFWFITFWLATRPISAYFGDMMNYMLAFQGYLYTDQVNPNGDYLFEAMMLFFAKNFNAESFFFFCTLLYFIPIYLAYRKIFKSFWPLVFILSTIVIAFYGFAVNGIRNGIAAQIFLLGLALPKRVGWALILTAIGFHSSMLIPAIGYFSAIVVREVKFYFAFWLLALVTSVFYSGFGELMQNFGLTNNKLDGYISDDTLADQFSMTGYRYDFVLYSAFPVGVAAYYIFKRDFKDAFYYHMTSVYLFANAIFILMNEMLFSNRFAYLSWFMMTIILIYPIYKLRTKQDVNVLLAIILYLLSSYLIVT